MSKDWTYRNQMPIEDKIFLGIGILVIVVIVMFGVVLPIVKLKGGLMPNYSNGERTGTVFKMSYKGMIWKSWEGEMNLGGVRNGENGVVANTFAFSIRDESVVKTLQEASKSGNRVTLTYNQYLFSPMQIGTDVLVTKVVYDDDDVEKK